MLKKSAKTDNTEKNRETREWKEAGKDIRKWDHPLHNLKRLNLSYPQSLIKVSDLGEAINLECIILEGCIKLKQIHSSIGLVRKLTTLNLKDCTSLITIFQ
ncbi:hypothetical protein CR513_43260, partial [Mucuna pruriens]